MVSHNGSLHFMVSYPKTFIVLYFNELEGLYSVLIYIYIYKLYNSYIIRIRYSGPNQRVYSRLDTTLLLIQTPKILEEDFTMLLIKFHCLQYPVKKNNGVKKSGFPQL